MIDLIALRQERKKKNNFFPKNNKNKKLIYLYINARVFQNRRVKKRL